MQYLILEEINKAKWRLSHFDSCLHHREQPLAASVSHSAALLPCRTKLHNPQQIPNNYAPCFIEKKCNIKKFCSICENCGLELPYEYVPLHLNIWKGSLRVSLCDICSFFSVVRWGIRGARTHTHKHARSHASLHRPALVGLTCERCPLTPVQLKGFVPSAAAFEDANQHYLLGRRTRVKGIHSLSLTELVSLGRIPPKTSPSSLIMLHRRQAK